MDMSYDDNLLTPKVPDSLKTGIVAYMKTTAEQFQKKLPEAMKRVIMVDLMRAGEVMVVTYPADELFNPNDTLLSKYADRSLQEIIPLMKDPFLYKVVYGVNSDDTGSENYRFSLTDARMSSIYDWMIKKIDDNKIAEDIIIIPASLGSQNQLTDNRTRDNRRKNRRIEFYFIPGPELMDKVAGKK